MELPETTQDVTVDWLNQALHELRHAKLVSSPGVGHELGRRSDLVLPQVKTFLAEGMVNEYEIS